MPLSERLSRIVFTGRLLLRKFLADGCTTHAAALAFSSMLSIVPFLAIIFAILKAFDVHTALAPMILANVAGGSQEIVSRILRYISNTRVGSLGVVGLVTLLMSVMATLHNIETAFNQIWGLGQGKTYHHKLRDYLIVILSIPLLIALAASITTGLQNQALVQWFFRLPGLGYLLVPLFHLLPYLSIWIALICLYLFIPNTRVRFKNALIGGVTAGTVWQLAQWTFIHLQVGVSRSNAIYGTLALLPVFMVWIYTGWIIVLSGMEIVCHVQGRDVSRDAPPKAGEDDKSRQMAHSRASGED
jgi:membrane protein